MAITISVNAGSGTGASASLSGASNDTNGEITLSTGTGVSGGSSFATITFNTPYASAPSYISLQRYDHASNVTALADIAVINVTANGFDFTINAGGGLNSLSNLKWGYQVTA